MKNNLEEVWREEFEEYYFKTINRHTRYVSKEEIANNSYQYKDMLLSYIEARKKTQKKTNELEQELQKTREQLSKAEQRIFHAPHCVTNYTRNDCDCGYEQYFKDKQGEG